MFFWFSRGFAAYPKPGYQRGAGVPGRGHTGVLGMPGSLVSGKPYKFIGFGGIRGPKTYKFIGFGGIHGTKPYKFIGFGGIHGPKPRAKRARRESVPKGPQRVLWGSPGLVRDLRSKTRPWHKCILGAKRAPCGQLDTTWYYLALPGATWHYLVLPGTTWYYLVLLGTTWHYLVAPGNTR